jgi:hypothetical protein
VDYVNKRSIIGFQLDRKQAAKQESVLREDFAYSYSSESGYLHQEEIKRKANGLIYKYLS